MVDHLSTASDVPTQVIYVSSYTHIPTFTCVSSFVVNILSHFQFKIKSFEMRFKCVGVRLWRILFLFQHTKEKDVFSCLEWKNLTSLCRDLTQTSLGWTGALSQTLSALDPTNVFSG